MTRDEFQTWAASFTDDQLAHIKTPHLSEASDMDKMVLEHNDAHARADGHKVELEEYRVVHTAQWSEKVRELGRLLKAAEQRNGELVKLLEATQRIGAMIGGA